MLAAFYRLTNFLHGIFISFLSSLHIVEMIMNGKNENAITLWQCFRWCTVDQELHVICLYVASVFYFISLFFLIFICNWHLIVEACMFLLFSLCRLASGNCSLHSTKACVHKKMHYNETMQNEMWFAPCCSSNRAGPAVWTSLSPSPLHSSLHSVMLFGNSDPPVLVICLPDTRWLERTLTRWFSWCMLVTKCHEVHASRSWLLSSLVLPPQV